MEEFEVPPELLGDEGLAVVGKPTDADYVPLAEHAKIPMLGLTQPSNYLTLKGSFSAVSKQNVASKYALESTRRDLQNALLCTVLESNPKNQENLALSSIFV